MLQLLQGLRLDGHWRSAASMSSPPLSPDDGLCGDLPHLGSLHADRHSTTSTSTANALRFAANALETAAKSETWTSVSPLARLAPHRVKTWRPRHSSKFSACRCAATFPDRIWMRASAALFPGCPSRAYPSACECLRRFVAADRLSGSPYSWHAPICNYDRHPNERRPQLLLAI